MHVHMDIRRAYIPKPTAPAPEALHTAPENSP